MYIIENQAGTQPLMFILALNENNPFINPYIWWLCQTLCNKSSLIMLVYRKSPDKSLLLIYFKHSFNINQWTLNLHLWLIRIHMEKSFNKKIKTTWGNTRICLKSFQISCRWWCTWGGPDNHWKWQRYQNLRTRCRTTCPSPSPQAEAESGPDSLVWPVPSGLLLPQSTRTLPFLASTSPELLLYC